MLKTIITGLLIFIFTYAITFVTVHLYVHRDNAYFSISGKYYVTWDAEGDYLIWETKPIFKDGIWMPKDPLNFNCYPISKEVANLITESPWTGFIKSIKQND